MPGDVSRQKSDSGDDLIRRRKEQVYLGGDGTVDPDGSADEHALIQLQRTYGNRAVQRYLRQNGGAGSALQRDATAPAPRFPIVGLGGSMSPLTAQIALGQHAADDGTAKAQAGLLTWLDGTVGELQSWAMGLKTMEAIVAKAKQQAPGADKLADDAIRRVILGWAASHNIKPQPGTGGSKDVLRGRLEEAVQSALGAAAEGVTVTLVEKSRGAGGASVTFQVNVSVQGATAKLKVGATELSGTVAYDKGIKASLGNDNINFSAEMTPNSWTLKLNVGLDPEVPDLSTVGKVFDKAQRGLADLVAHPEKHSQDDVATSMRDVGDAMDALQGIAKAPHLSASISAGSTEPGPASAGEAAVPKGWQVTVSLSGTF